MDTVLIDRALRWTPGFSSWPAQTRTRLIASARLVRHRRGTRFGTTVDGVPHTLVVVTGHLQVSHVRADGFRSTIGIVGPGRVFGITPTPSSDEESVFEFRVHDDAVIVSIPSPDLLQLLDAEPVLWRDMTRMLLRQQHEMLGNVLDQLSGEIRSRLAATIDHLATQHGVSEGAGKTLRLRLSQADLASMLQVSRQTINKGLSWLEQSGVISPDYYSISILDHRKLKRISGKAVDVTSPA
jgi:CRP-like cAMP-binding protein